MATTTCPLEQFIAFVRPVARGFFENDLQITVERPGVFNLTYNGWFTLQYKYHLLDKIIEIHIADISLRDGDGEPPRGLTGTRVLDFAFQLAEHSKLNLESTFTDVCLTLDDTSFIQFQRPDGTTIAIPFYMIRLLATGQSWYNQYGFVTRDPDELDADLDAEDLQKDQLEEIRQRPYKDTTIGEAARLFLGTIREFPAVLQNDKQIEFVSFVRSWILQFIDESSPNYIEYYSDLIYILE